MSNSSKPEKAEDRAATESSQKSPHSPAQVDPTVQGVLGRKLKESYEALVKEEVPAKFLELLDQLKKKESPSPKDGD